MKHIVLLGDSIFDNAAYVNGAPDVVARLREKLVSDERATLLAVDGNYARDVTAQLAKLPPDATHLVISAGGNNALEYAHLLMEPATSFAEVVGRFADIGGAFAKEYSAMLESVLALRLPTMLCTIYDANFPDASTQKLIQTALAHFNEVILRAAIGHGLPVLDLRFICTAPTDYANEIEPSSAGGDKIAAAIYYALSTHNFAGTTSIYV